MDSTGHVFAEGENIDKIMEELNYDPYGGNEWRYYYRSSDSVVYAYFTTSGEADYNGEFADETYDVIED